MIRAVKRWKFEWFWLHQSPQKSGQNGAARYTRGQQKMRVTSEVLGRQPEGVDQIEQPNPDGMGSGWTCLALTVTKCVDHVSPTTTQSRNWSDLIWLCNTETIVRMCNGIKYPLPSSFLSLHILPILLSSISLKSLEWLFTLQPLDLLSQHFISSSY